MAFWLLHGYFPNCLVSHAAQVKTADAQEIFETTCKFGLALESRFRPYQNVDSCQQGAFSKQKMKVSKWFFFITTQHVWVTLSTVGKKAFFKYSVKLRWFFPKNHIIANLLAAEKILKPDRTIGILPQLKQWKFVVKLTTISNNACSTSPTMYDGNFMEIGQGVYRIIKTSLETTSLTSA